VRSQQLRAASDEVMTYFPWDYRDDYRMRRNRVVPYRGSARTYQMPDVHAVEPRERVFTVDVRGQLPDPTVPLRRVRDELRRGRGVAEGDLARCDGRVVGGVYASQEAEGRVPAGSRP
jgi:hypothetical protein